MITGVQKTKGSWENVIFDNSNNGNKIFGKGCVNCHQQIHGSNHPNGQMFLR